MDIKLNVNEKAVRLSELVVDDFYNKGLILASVNDDANRVKKHTSEYNKYFKDNNLKDCTQDFIKSYLIAHNQYELYLEYVLSLDKYFKELEKLYQNVHLTLVCYAVNDSFTFKIVKSKYNELRERTEIQTLLQLTNNKPFYKLQASDLVGIKKGVLKDIEKVLNNYLCRKNQSVGLSIKDVQTQLANDIEYVKELNSKNKDIVTSSTMAFFRFKEKRELEIKKEFEKRQTELKNN